MRSDFSTIRQETIDKLYRWLVSCTRNRKISRNTLAVGIVVLDHLRRKCPVEREDVISAGGEVKGTRSGLAGVLQKYGLPASFLKETTTRQAHQDGIRLFGDLNWGATLIPLQAGDRDTLLQEMIGILTEKANEWLQRQNLKLNLDRRYSPTTWIEVILENAKGRSGGIVEQHLVGAKLERRYPDRVVPNYPAHAADHQTARDGDFTIANTVYHVTASPSLSVIQKCASNIQAGRYPVLVVPRTHVGRVEAWAELENIRSELTVFAIEDFVALNILELADSQGKERFAILMEIIGVYNRRLAEVETDLSLQIEVR